MNVNLSTADLRQKDADYHLHPFTDHKSLKLEDRRIMARGDGVWLWDTDGNRILDGMAGLWCMGLGYGRSEIIEAVRNQMYELPFYNTFFKTSHQPVIRLAELLAEITPPQFKMSFFGGSGSDGNDTIVRMARTYFQKIDKPEKNIIISRHNAYHGSTITGSALGGMSGMHEQSGTLSDVSHIMQPYWFGEGGELTEDEFGIKAAQALGERIDELGEHRVAAFIAEPIQGAGGVIIPPKTYWPEIKRILDERDILFISDEVICGFGRTGNWFGCETFGTEPDFMTMAKGITSGYLPLGAVAVSEKIASVFRETDGDFNHGYTYSGHPAACAAAISTIEIMKRENIIERVAKDIGPYLQKRWKKLGEHPLVGDANMVGLMGNLELVPDKTDRSKRFANDGQAGMIARDFSFKNGLIMRAVRDRLILAPPLTITHEECDELIAKASKTLDMAHDQLRKQGMV